MSTCKKCGKETSLFNSLCDDCIKEQKQQELINKKKTEEEFRMKAEERKQKMIEDTKGLIDKIVKATTREAPLMYMFITNNVKEKEKNILNIGAILVGGALGGITGAAIGGAIAPQSYSYTGDVGILVVTKKSIIIKFFETGLFSSYRISQDILQRLLNNLTSETNIGKRVFEILKSDISEETLNSGQIKTVITSGSYVFSFNSACVFLNEDEKVILPSENDLITLFNELGGLISPHDFVKKLLNEKIPMNEYQYDSVKTDSSYFDRIFAIISGHENRDLIIKNFSNLIPALRSKLESKIIETAGYLYLYLTVIVVLVLVILFIIYGIIYYAKINDKQYLEQDFIFWLLSFFSLIISLFPVLGIIEYANKFFKAKWCRKIIVNYEVKKDI